MTCGVCGEPAGPDAQWCEACGASLTDDSIGAVDGPACVDCGAAHIEIVDGYCGQCGRKQPGERDHLTEHLNGIAAVTHRGRRHHQNEDAFAISSVDGRAIAIVCDGVSTTDNPQDASLAAANAARDSLVVALESGDTDYQAMLASAVAAAQVAAAAVPGILGGHGPASTTIVATLMVPSETDVRTWTAWLGDSRAYWVSGDLSLPVVTQLTVDDEWEGSITRWLGADAAATDPTLQAFEHDPGGTLLLCSDGLWKYVPDADDLAGLLAANAEISGLELAEVLVAFANEQGGHDNTTVVIAAS